MKWGHTTDQRLTLPTGTHRRSTGLPARRPHGRRCRGRGRVVPSRPFRGQALRRVDQLATRSCERSGASLAVGGDARRGSRASRPAPIAAAGCRAVIGFLTRRRPTGVVPGADVCTAVRPQAVLFARGIAVPGTGAGTAPPGQDRPAGVPDPPRGDVQDQAADQGCAPAFRRVGQHPFDRCGSPALAASGPASHHQAWTTAPTVATRAMARRTRRRAERPGPARTPPARRRGRRRHPYSAMADGCRACSSTATPGRPPDQASDS